MNIARFTFLLSLIFLWPILASADEGAHFSIGGDWFGAGRTVTVQDQGIDDLFAAGETVDVRTDIGGTAHVAGRRVRVNGSAGGGIYAAGETVTVSGDVAGDVTATGYEVTFDGSLGGDLRASGSTVAVNGSIDGYALLAGETVDLAGIVKGDANVSGGSIKIGDGARVGGTLRIYEKNIGDTVVPEGVVPPERLERHLQSEYEGERGHTRRGFSWGRAIGKFAGGVIVVALIASLVAAIAPERLARMRTRLLDRPFRTLWFGFLGESVLVGSALVVALSVIGLVVTPAVLLLAVLGAVAGYIIGAYSLGAGILLAAGRGEPASLGQRMLAAGVGALVAAFVALIPFLGWLFVLLLTLTGFGALVTALFRPVFFADA